ncbi:MAG: hypothetical protein FJW36_03215 [Acidobacteria bacterium]|nr:hypothetical protein [Acidobacteriota bacterium]
MKTFLSLLLISMPLWGGDVYASVNGVQRAVVWPGMPVVVEGFAPTDEPLRAEVLDEQGKLKEWPWRVVAAGEGRRGEWIVEGTDTTGMTAGLYQVRVASGSGSSKVCRLQVMARPEAPDEAAFRREWNWKLYEVRRRGDVEGALRLVDGWLEGHEEDVLDLSLKAELLVEAGRSAEALGAYQVAIEKEELVRQRLGSKEPAGELRRKRDEVMVKMLQRP